MRHPARQVVNLLLLSALLPAAQAFAGVGFASGRTFQAGANPNAIAIGDFNGDGKPDVVVVDNGASSSNAQNVNVLLNNGDGTFTRVATSLNSIFVLGVAVGDFNHDGKLDIAFFGQTYFAVLLGNGDGTFAPLTTTYPTGTSTGSYPISIAVGDFNGDGALDVAIALLNDSAIQLFSNNGSGTFTVLPETPTCGNPGSLVVADFNGDGKQDIAVACQTGSVSILLGDGNNHFQTLPAGGVMPGPYSIAAADLNGDGRADLVTANNTGSSATVLLGNGDGSFRVSSPIPLSSQPFSVVIADVSRDGIPDVLELTHGGNDLLVLVGKGDGTFAPPTSFQAGGAPLSFSDRSLVVADFDGDGKPDVMALNDGTHVTLLLGNGDGTFAPSAQTLQTGIGAGTTWVALGDFNGDSNMDLVVANSLTNSVAIFLGNAQAQFTIGATYGVGIDPEFVTTADLNGDGKLDIVVVCKGNASTPGSVRILLGNGDGTFAAATPLTPGLAPIAAAVGDFNNDTKLDLAIVDEGDDTNPSVVAVYLGMGDGSFQGPTDYNVGVSPQAIATGKIIGGVNLDLVVADSRNGDLRVLQGFGNGSFGTQTFLTLPSIAARASVAVADLDGDGELDVIAPSANGVVVFLNQLKETGQFAAPKTYAADPGVFQVATADFDGDGHVDVVATGQDSGVDLLRGNGDGTLQPSLGFAAGVFPWSWTVADVNHDGLPDVLVASPGSPSTVTILLNAMGQTASISSSANPSQFHQPVRFTASFLPTVRERASGTAVFSDSNTVLASVPINTNGEAQLQTRPAVGVHSISVNYSGSDFVPKSASITQTVTQATAVIDVISSENPALVGASVMLTATFTGPFGGTGTGTFAFMEGATVLSSGSVNASGQGKLSKSDWAVGPHSITVSYSGDGNFLSGITMFSQVIQNPTTITLTSSAASVLVGANITLTAVVTSAAAPPPTGTVDFISDGNTVIGSASLDGSGRAVLNTSSIVGGVHAITARYRGDNFSAVSTTPATSVSVADFGITVQPSAAILRAGQSATITISITGLGGFSSQVILSCGNLPANSTCAFSPPNVTAAASVVTSTLVFQTAGMASELLPAARPNSRGGGLLVALVSFSVVGIALMGAGSRKRHAMLAILITAVIVSLVSCGGGGSNSSTPPVPTTPSGVTNITVVATSSVSGTTITHQVPVSITVTQ